jgi:hypothetical protein
MKGKILAVGLAVVVAVLIMLAVSGVFTSPYFNEKTQFGEWGQDIKINYEDGTSESLSVLMNKPLSVITYNSKAITGFDYTLNVKASGSGYTDATVTLGSYALNVNYRQPVDPQKPQLGSTVKGTSSFTLVSGANTVAFDNVFHPIGGTATVGKSKIDSLGLADGTYIYEFVPSGTVSYRGNPGGSESAGSMPAAVSCTVTYQKNTGTVSIVITGGATSY